MSNNVTFLVRRRPVAITYVRLLKSMSSDWLDNATLWPERTTSDLWPVHIKVFKNIIFASSQRIKRV